MQFPGNVRMKLYAIWLMSDRRLTEYSDFKKTEASSFKYFMSEKRKTDFQWVNMLFHQPSH